MSDEFEWQTEVESGWEANPVASAEPGRGLSRRVKVITLAVALCLLSSAAIGVYGTLNRRVKDATNAAESAVLLAHQLLTSSALDGDADLFDTLVAERPASWHALNADLLAGQLFFGRRPLGIEVPRRPGQGAEYEVEVHLAPELDAAEVIDRRPYSFHMGNEGSRTILLERTFHYQRDGDQWRLAPPADEREFWGKWVQEERANLTLVYPERDERLARQLSSYLDGFLPALCADLRLACPDDFHLAFKLETDPASIRRLGEGLFAIRAGSASTDDRLVLPAPSLIGLPVNDDGFEALRRGYAGWIGGAIIASYAAPEPAAALAAVEQILADYDLQAPPDPVQPLPRPAMAAFPSGATAPEQDVLLLCGDASIMRLLRFQTATGKWREEAPDSLWRQVGSQQSGPPAGARSYMSRLPDYSGAIVQTSDDDGPGSMWRTYLWHDGAARLLTEETTTHYYLPPRLLPSNQPSDPYLAFFVPGEEGGGEPFRALLVDVERCGVGPCELEALAGMPVWSPSGRRTLLIVDELEGAPTLMLGDARGQAVAHVGPGLSPTWLDEDRFIYVSGEAASEPDELGRVTGRQVILATIDDREQVVISQAPYFDAETVRQAIPASIKPPALGLWSAQPALDGDIWWFIAARSEEEDGPDFTLVYNRLSGEARLAAAMGRFRLVETPMIDPTGQHAVLIGLSAGGAQLSVELIDAVTGDMRRLEEMVPADWSADGRWLIQSGTGASIKLVSADGAFEWPIGPDLSGCYWAVWTQR